MAALPAYVTVLFSDLSEGFDPEVIVSPMERGLQKLRLGNSRVVVQVPVRLRLNRTQDITMTGKLSGFKTSFA